MTTPVPIAIVGMACRLPGGVNSPEDLWDMVAEGRSGHGPVPPGRWNTEAFYHPDTGAVESVVYKDAHFLEGDVTAFDARFFRMPARDAVGMDPQHRMLLEVTHEALENAGIPTESIKGTMASVFLAEFTRDFDYMAQKDLPIINKKHVLGAGDALMANRLSYMMDLQGPSLVLDTGCSGSLVAIHQACQSLRTGESPLAITGACQLILQPDQSMAMTQLGMMNKDGKCYVWDDRGEGYGRGEGCGIMILKRLDDAIRDGDSVQAVIAHSGVNQDGKTLGITLPSVDAQIALARSVYAAAGLDPAETLYIEAHGTGTQAGDKVEITGIRQAFCEDVQRKDDLLVGSVKANIGHLECTSGVAGMIKAVMVLKKGMVPANINLETPKPALPLEGAPIQLPVENVPLASPDFQGTKRVSVNGFGYGGTNAHFILEEGDAAKRPTPSPAANGIAHVNGANGVNGVNGHVLNGNTSNGNTVNGHTVNGNGAAYNGVNGVTGVNGKATNGHAHAGTTEPLVNGKETTVSSPQPQMFVLSAAAEISLAQMAKNLKQWATRSERRLDSNSLSDLSHTLALRRNTYSWRTSVVASTAEELISQLSTAKPVQAPSASNVTFVFTGQGAQWYAMGRELLQTPARNAFRDSILRSDKLLTSWGTTWSLQTELLKNEKESRLNEAELSQPITTAVQVALADLLAELDVVPQRVCGHSSGEIAAAYAAGALSHEAAIQASYLRGLCSKKAIESNAQKGSMIATGLGEDGIRPYIDALKRGAVVTACINSPASTTVSGDETGIDELAEALTEAGVFNRKLKVETAYHSHHMETVAHDYEQALAAIEHGNASKSTAFFSSVTGARKIADFGPEYWTKNLVSPVQFQKALRAIADDIAAAGRATASAPNLLIEIGPHSALSGPARQILSAEELGEDRTFSYTYLSPLVRGKPALQTTLECVGKLFEAGLPLAMDKIQSLTTTPSNKGPTVVSDLAPYPWDHSTSYWNESRISREHRNRRFPHHELIGTLDVAGDPGRPRWRHYIEADKIPWCKDHVVDGFVIFPGTGYLGMAMEALGQLVQLRGTAKRITRFVFRDVRITSSLVVPDGGANPIEVQITLTPDVGGSKEEMFRVCSFDTKNTTGLNATGTWVEHATGFITAILERRGSEDFDAARMDNEQAEGESQMFEEIRAAATNPVDATAFYEKLADAGNLFGPTFRGMQELHLGDHTAFSRNIVPDIASSMPGNHMETKYAHPVLLDSLSHTIAAMFRNQYSTSPFVMQGIDSLIVSTRLTKTPGAELSVVSRLVPEETSRRAALGRAWTFQEFPDGHREVMSAMQGRLRVVGEEQSADDESGLFRRLTGYKMDWELDADHLSNEKFNARLDKLGLFGLGTPPGLTCYEAVYIREITALLFIRRAVEEFRASSDKQVDPSQPHLLKLWDWMQRVIDNHGTPSSITPPIPVIADTQPFEKLDPEFMLEECMKTGPNGELFVRVMRSLMGVLQGIIDPLQVIFKDDLIERAYATDMIKTNYLQLQEFVRPLGFKNPRMRILEVGAGTGGASTSVLEALTDPVDGLMFSKYCYTDVSAGFFEKAKVKFSKWVHRMDFSVLDIMADPATQRRFEWCDGEDNEDQKFDLIVASNVLHATPSLGTTLRHCHKLLRPGGRLVLVELTRVTLSYNMIFGVLPGWWLSSDFRSSNDAPVISASEWSKCLKESGYSGVDLAANDHKGDTAMTTFMASTAVKAESIEVNGASNGEAVETSDSHNITVIVRDSADAVTAQLANHVVQHLEVSSQTKCSIADWVSVSDMDNGHFVVLDMAERPVLKDPSTDEFAAVQRLCVMSRNVLWCSFQCSASSATTTAQKALITGLRRSATSENPFMQMISLDIRNPVTSDGTTVHDATQAIVNLVHSRFWHTATGPALGQDPEPEFALENGELLIPRIRVDAALNSWCTSTRENDRVKTTTMVDYHDPQRALMLEAETPGLFSSLRFVDDISAAEPLDPMEVEMRPYAYGVNFHDVYVALGQGGAADIMQGESSGVVTAVGDKMTHLYKVGDRVVGMHPRAYASRPRFHGYSGRQFPDSMSFAEAASAPAVYTTAYHCLVTLANLQKGETVLIHSGSGGVGQAAINLAKHLGAEIFTTVGSAAKKELIMEKFGLPASHILSSNTTKFKDAILRLTNGNGCDVILSSHAGDRFEASLECIAELGRYVEIGKAGLTTRGSIKMSHIEKGVSFFSVDISLLRTRRQRVVYDALGAVFDLLSSGAVAPVSPITTFPIGKVEDAFRMIAARKHTGKLVMVTGEGKDDETSLVKAVLPAPKPLRLHSQGTYIIAGGLGDLGRRACIQLAKAGAGYVVTLSRSLPSEEEVLAPIRAEMTQHDCTLKTMRCDLTDAASVARAVETIRSELPVVRGVINAAIVLKERPLETMTLQEFETAMKPKVWGTLNLHNAFVSDDLDFFTLLASTAGILGLKGLSNYAVGNTFQDAFAHAYNAAIKANPHSARRTRYVSIDIGAVAETGHTSNFVEHAKESQKVGAPVMTVHEIAGLLEYAMGTGAVEADTSQAIFGFHRGHFLAQDRDFALRNPIYSLLPDVGTSGDANKDASAGAKGGEDPVLLVKKAKTLDEVEEIITNAAAEKFAVFLGIEVPVDVPISQLAVDSLVSIELKNWMSRTFGAPVQVSEVVGASSIAALAALLASRSKLVSDELRTKEPSDNAVPEEEGPNGYNGNGVKENGVNGTNGHTATASKLNGHGPKHGWLCCSQSETLPRLPLADLDEALDYMLENKAGVLSQADFAILSAEVKKLREPGGPGREVHAKLQALHDDPTIDSWQHDLATKFQYLGHRKPLAPYFSFWGTIAEEVAETYSQSQQAALAVLTAVDFRRHVQAHTVEPFYILGKAVCDDQLDNLFGVVREPREGGDALVRYPDSQHIVVLRKGHAFRVDLKESGRDVTFATLEATFRAIVGRVKGDDLGTGLLTTDGRDNWARNRLQAMEASPVNAEYISTIEAAVLVVCLDNASPGESEIMRQAWLNDGSNRWFDKSVQLVVADNGKFSIIAEHAALDGLPMWRFVMSRNNIMESVASALKQGEVIPADQVTLHELTFQSTPALDLQMQELRSIYSTVTSAAGSVSHHITAFGTDDLMRWRAPAKAAIDATLQLAIRLHYGRHVPCWEPVSMSLYHKGRHDMLHVSTPTAVSLVADLAAGTASAKDARTRLGALGREAASDTQRALQGRNYHRLLEVMAEAWPTGEGAPPKAEMLAKHMSWGSGPCCVMAHTVDLDIATYGTQGLPRPGCFFLSVTPSSDRIIMMIVGDADRVGPLAKCLDEAAQIMKTVMTAN